MEELEQATAKAKPGPKPKVKEVEAVEVDEATVPSRASTNVKYEKWQVTFKGNEFEKLKLVHTVFVEDWVADELNTTTSQMNPYHYYKAK
jgi:hypothetical protein